MRILIANNGADVANLSRLAGRRDWDVTEVTTDDDAEFYAAEVDFQLIFVIVGGRKVDRFSMLKTVSRSNLGCPIIAILERDCPIERAQAWQASALICLTQFATQKEIEMAALSAIRFQSSMQTDIIENGCMALDVAKREFRVDDVPVIFTRKQFQFLERLMLSKGRTVTRDQLMNHLYGFETFPDGKILDVMICKLRAKLEALGVNSEALQTVWGVGYRLNPPQKRDVVEQGSWHLQVVNEAVAGKG